ncbi:MAG: hypothetical protein IJ053_01255, partial [Lachnospiraceae bacterium]|nr:hypothetical protein [Lachnospiraceae bacterium]
KHYYAKQIPIDITFDGKELTDDEINDILDLLKDKGLNIKYNEIDVIETPKKENNFTDIQSDKDGLLYVGNLKNGQSIDAVTSIIIVGNIEQGASVTSEGNIIIIGELNGYAKAGSKGKKDAFVYNVY